MTCEEALLLLSGHIDGQNTELEEEALRAHLAACPSCRALLERYEQVDRCAAQLAEEPPAELFGAVMDRIRLETDLPARPVKKRRWFFGPGTAVAAAAAVLLLLMASGKVPGLSVDRAKSSAAVSPDEATEAAEAYAAETAASAAESTPSTIEPALASGPATTASEEAVTAGGADTPAAGETAPASGPATTASEKAVTSGGADTSAAKSVPAVGETPPASDPATTASEETVTPGGADAPDAQDFAIVAPAAVGEASQIHLTIQDDEKMTAVRTITELASLPTQPAGDGGTDWYVADVATAKAIQKKYAESYGMELANADGAADDAVCLIRVTEP